MEAKEKKNQTKNKKNIEMEGRQEALKEGEDDIKNYKTRMAVPEMQLDFIPGCHHVSHLCTGTESGRKRRETETYLGIHKPSKKYFNKLKSKDENMKPEERKAATVFIKENFEKALSNFELQKVKRPIEEMLYWLCRLEAHKEVVFTFTPIPEKQILKFEGDLLTPMQFWERTKILASGTLTKFIRTDPDMKNKCAAVTGKRYLVYEISTVIFLSQCNSPPIKKRAAEYLKKILKQEDAPCPTWKPNVPYPR